MQAKKLNFESLKAHNSISETEYPNANKNKRVLAFFLDCLLGAGISKLLEVLLNFVVSNDGAEGLASITVLVFYWALPTYNNGQTLGKKWLGLKVISMDGGELTLGQSLMREILGRILSTISLFIGYFWVLFNKDQRAWHDYIGKTRVIQYK